MNLPDTPAERQALAELQRLARHKAPAPPVPTSQAADIAARLLADLTGPIDTRPSAGTEAGKGGDRDC